MATQRFIAAICACLCWQSCNSSEPDLVSKNTIKLTSIAGNGKIGAVDGPGSIAEFNGPTGIDVNQIGHVYIADHTNHRIRIINIDGVVRTFAGSNGGLADGPGDKARFNQPQDVALDKQGNAFVSDLTNDRIRRISPTGEVTSFVRVLTPKYITIDQSGNLYVTDANIYKISKVTPDGKVTEFVRAGEQGYFNVPLQGIAADQEGNVYAADVGNRRIIKITPAGEISTYPREGSKFDDLRGLAVDKNGNVFVTDGSSIRLISTDGVVSTLEVANRDAPTILSPYDLAFDTDGNLYIADVEGQRILKGVVTME